jgi:uncharacterized membrane protein YkvI
MKNGDNSFALRSRYFIFRVTKWFGGLHPLLFWVIVFGLGNPIDGIPVVAAVLVPLLAIGMYSIARRQGLSHAGAVEFLHGTRYLNGGPVIWPERPAKV